MELFSAFYTHLMSLVPGSTSLNELRVMAAIGIATLEDEHIGITELSARLDIPLSTASRLAARLCADGNVVAMRHPRDDRRRSLRLTTEHLDRLADWIQHWVSIREHLSELAAA